MIKNLLFCLFFVFAPLAYALSPKEAVFSYVHNGNEDALKSAIKKDKLLLFSTDKHGNTLIIAAARYGQNNMIKYLHSVWPDWDKTNKYGETALHAAIRFKHPATAQLIVNLVAKDPDIQLNNFINIADTAQQQTPLHWAAQQCDQALYSFLVNWGANPSLNNKLGQTPQNLLAACPSSTEDKAE